jgi:HK97 family phage major capsid protein
MTHALSIPETKSANGELGAALEDFVRAFEAFRETNDARLGETETRLTADVVTEDKLVRIDTALNEAKQRLDPMAMESRRPHLGAPAGEQRDPALAEHKAAFDTYVRTGAPRGQGPFGRLGSGRRLPRAGDGRTRGAAPARGDLADPRHRLRAGHLERAV